MARAATAIATGDYKSHRLRSFTEFFAVLTDHHFLDWETVQIEKKKKKRKQPNHARIRTYETVVWQFIDLDGSNAINMLPLNLRLISKLLNNLTI